MDSVEANKKLKEIIEARKKDMFVKTYQNKATDEKVLGVMISQYFKWSGKPIVDTFLNALEDSNFHELRGKIEDLYNEDEKRVTARLKK